MRIKRLDICGFKSFMDRVVFQFDDGITGVVGPNGCGKSNVVDAIRWVMGEQSAKHLRGRSMEDVIFNGSESKAPLSMAEVTLTFYNDSPSQVPVQYQGFAELGITRRLFRNGDSEYQINKTPCRLLDIIELFLGTGVGTKAYSIIEQGRIGLIVSSKPEDRRALIEEAAGITRYKARRKAAERKMELTEQNLLRVSDIVKELGKRLDTLNRQARKAEKYKKLKADMRGLELHLAAHRYLELTALIKASRAQLDGLAVTERSLAEKVRTGEEQIAAQRAALERDEAARDQLSDRAHGLSNALEVGAANLQGYGREHEAAGRRMAEADRELSEIAASRSALAEEQTRVRDERAALDGHAGGDDERLSAVEQHLARTAEEEVAVARAIEQERAGLVAALSRLASARSSLASVARQRADLQSRLEKTEAERDGLSAKALELERCRSASLAKLGASRQMKLALEEQRAGEEEALARVKRELEGTDAEVHAQKDELSSRKSRLQSLRELEKNYEGYGRGVRAVLHRAGDRAREEGILGLVAELIRAPKEFEKAIEAALGERLQAIVVDGRDRALSLLTYLRSAHEGRGAFLPVDATAGAPRAFADVSRDGVLGCALDLVQVDNGCAAVVEKLLGHVVIVRDLEAAAALAQDGHAFTVVTLEGEVLEPTGGMVGGALEGPGVGALQKRREVAELSETVAGLETSLKVVQEQRRRLSERAAQIEGTLRGLAKDTHSGELSVVEQEKDLHKTTDDLAHARERLSRLSQDADTLSRRLEEMGLEEMASRKAIEHGESEQRAREARGQELAESLASLRAALTSLVAEQTALKVKVAADAERKEGLSRRLEKLSETLAELEDRRARLATAVAEAQERRVALVARTEETERAVIEGKAQLKEVAQALATAREACAAAAARVRDEEGGLREARNALTEIQAGLSAHALDEREHALARSHVCETVRERHALDLTFELYRYHQEPSPTKEQEAQLKDLREQVERMGEINLTAISEFDELSQRHAFLSRQKEDLEESIAQLRRAIARINRTSKERFQQTFEIVNEKFQQIFPRLFNGGRAGLTLTEGDDGLEGGIEILAQPPGKKLQSVNLLSGGEKALTAVALIFAIFLIKPTPFCLLDEVDAPLDDANVGRYNDMVREMSSESQFILITHNKRTMQVVDTLYGVTMEEAGISKLVAVKMSERATEERVLASA